MFLSEIVFAQCIDLEDKRVNPPLYEQGTSEIDFQAARDAGHLSR